MIDSIITYFEQMPSSHRTVLLVGGLLFFWVMESILPFFERDYPVRKHALHNLFFTVTTAVVNLPLAFILVMTSHYMVSNGLGLLQWMNLGNWGMLIIGLLLLDFIGAWLIHYIQHHVKWMWIFHAVHHSDQHLDVTSGNRHHPVESVFRYVFTLLAVGILGAPMWLVFIYQTISVVLTQFNHSNVVLGTKLDAILKWVIVTPSMHRVHHHYRMPYSDMNYGNIFSFWDKIFQTFVVVDNRNIKFGLDTHPDAHESNQLWGMLKSPFKGYRSHIQYQEKEVL